jgi:two-component system, OmpR family, sensor histidine kinase BaeS
MGCVFGSINFLGFSLFILGIGWIATKLGWIQSPLEPFGWIVLIGVGLLVFLAMFIVVVVFSLRRFSRPLDELLVASDRVAEGDLSVRLEEKGLREMRSVARTFNSMAERLQASDRQRRDMLADVTHELRTPLTVIRGEVEGMLDGVYPADEARLKSVLEETELLTRLVDDLRTFSLAEAGALQLKREPTDVAALIIETVAAFRSAGDARGVRIESSVGESPSVEVDPVRVREVISNLITNALRYSPNGGVVRVAYDGATVSVTDDGSGIPPEVLPHIFERFYKSSDSGGMGLGLSIAKYLVEAHGGTIRAENAPGGGTSISFTLWHEQLV